MLEHTISEKYGTAKKVHLNDTEQPEAEAKLAFTFIERWGMVAGEVDGEDSAGRQKLRLSTPDGLVERAFTIAHIAMDRARATGLMHQTPTLAELED